MQGSVLYSSDNTTPTVRVQYITLVTTVLVASAHATSKLITPLFPVGEAIPTNRLLRTHTTSAAVPEEGEEKGLSLLSTADDFIYNLKVPWLLKSMESNGTSVREALTLLNADKAADNLLASREWNAWARYVRKVSPEDADDSIVGAMTARLGGDTVSKMIAAAMNNPKTKQVATALEAAQISRWLQRDFSPVEILAVQKLDKATDALFDSPQFATWSNYLAAYNKKNPKEAISVPDAFKQSYGEEGFIKLLAAVDDGPGATNFKDQLVKSWLADPDHPANIFKRLKLDEAGDGLLLSVWTKYMKAFNKEYPFAETTMIRTFTKIYGDEKLATMLQAGTKVPETEQFAKNLQTAQFKQWVAEKKTPDDIYMKVLKLDSTDSPNADIWRAYYNAYDKEYPGKLFSFQP